MMMLDELDYCTRCILEGSHISISINHLWGLCSGFKNQCNIGNEMSHQRGKESQTGKPETQCSNSYSSLNLKTMLFIGITEGETRSPAPDPPYMLIRFIEIIKYASCKT
jgi:hypothetical protein